MKDKIIKDDLGRPVLVYVKPERINFNGFMDSIIEQIAQAADVTADLILEEYNHER